VNSQLSGLVAQAVAAQAIAASGSRHPAARAGGGGGAQGLPTAAGLRSVIGAPSGGGSLGSQLAALRQCEAGGNYSTDTGNGYYGAYQISQSTWESLGYSGLPSDAPAGVQDQAAATLQARSGWGQWPTCSSILGL
ncbi:MAG: transglycosylase family protein, partial [Acidimicrobiales bacterium]